MTLKYEIAAGEMYGLGTTIVPSKDRAEYLMTAKAFANGKGWRLPCMANDIAVSCFGRHRTI